ncbi:transmembrane protein 216-like [Watersipora subatra]|uniref:transmembrane protein 216-like n=1 Tax=Watersipora subatra TaxID=2589382 RepID=UPI00355B3C3E
MAPPGVAQSKGGVFKPSLSSPQWQIFLYLHAYYMAALILAEFLIYIWKVSILPYPDGIIVFDVVLLLLIGLMEVGRIFWGMKGNLTERRLACFISIAMSVTSLCGALYFVLWQTYVLMLEFILLAIHMSFVVLETIFGIVTFSGILKSVPP